MEIKQNEELAQTDEERTNAATRIAASYRGKQARTSTKEKHQAAARCSSPVDLERKRSLWKSPTYLETKANTFVMRQRENPLFLHALAMGFQEADLDGDSMLSFDEFVGAVPKDVRNSADAGALREIFDIADADGNGFVSPDEFFLCRAAHSTARTYLLPTPTLRVCATSRSWSMHVSADHAGLNIWVLDKAFKKFDSSGDGRLNLLEFTQAVEQAPHGTAPTDDTPQPQAADASLSRRTRRPYGYAEVAHAVFAGNCLHRVSHPHRIRRSSARPLVWWRAVEQSSTAIALARSATTRSSPRSRSRRLPSRSVRAAVSCSRPCPLPTPTTTVGSTPLRHSIIRRSRARAAPLCSPRCASAWPHATHARSLRGAAYSP
jgi:Ca2+-binding EF-hand superfamily protein